MERVDRRRWQRITLTLNPRASDGLHELARRNVRDPKREALRLLTEGIERELDQAIREDLARP